MTRQEADTLWFRAMHESVKDGEQFTRYHFAALVAAAEREACAKVCDELAYFDAGDSAEAMRHCAQDIRARGTK
jgi:hypothetical protein